MVIKVVHFIHETSIKNISISQNIISFLKKFNDKNISTYVCSNKIDNHFKKKIKKKFLISYLDLLLNNKNLPKIIHVHGIWGFYEILIYLFFYLRQTQVIIHSHGMLIEEAMQNKGKLSYFKKIIFLKIMKILIKKKNIFVTSTNQEKKKIKTFFSSSEVKIVFNFLEDKIKNEMKNSKLNKSFVYFGRINKHKNIASIIKAFINTNLNLPWRLLIFGIPDDNVYRDKIKKISKNYKNINILNPIFDENKDKIIKKSWSNIVFSNSEILSYSFLESSILRVPTILSKKIYLGDIKYPKNFISKHSNVDLKKTMIKISNLSIKERISIGKNISYLVNTKINNKIVKNFFNKIYFK